jgi:hypothetical protein
MFRTIQVARFTIVAAGVLAGIARADSPQETIDLSPQVQPNALTRVTIELDAGGNDVVRAVTDVKSAAAKNGAEQKLPMSVSAQLQYDERRLDGGTSDSAQNRRPQAVRYYTLAEGILKVDTSGMAPKLADDCRLIVVEPAKRGVIYIR